MTSTLRLANFSVTEKVSGEFNLSRCASKMDRLSHSFIIVMEGNVKLGLSEEEEGSPLKRIRAVDGGGKRARSVSSESGDAKGEGSGTGIPAEHEVDVTDKEAYAMIQGLVNVSRFLTTARGELLAGGVSHDEFSSVLAQLHSCKDTATKMVNCRYRREDRLFRMFRMNQLNGSMFPCE